MDDYLAASLVVPCSSDVINSNWDFVRSTQGKRHWIYQCQPWNCHSCMFLSAFDSTADIFDSLSSCRVLCLPLVNPWYVAHNVIQY